MLSIRYYLRRFLSFSLFFGLMLSSASSVFASFAETASQATEVEASATYIYEGSSLSLLRHMQRLAEVWHSSTALDDDDQMYAILDAGESYSFQIGDLQISPGSSSFPELYGTDPFTVYVSDDLENYTVCGELTSEFYGSTADDYTTISLDCSGRYLKIAITISFLDSEPNRSARFRFRNIEEPWDIEITADESCSDGLLNQDETGIDIGGVCGGDEDADGYLSEDDGGFDCDDTDVAVNPGVTEILDDGIDNDCDETTFDDPDDYDLDGDSYSVNEDDCDDTDASIYLGATEVADDSIDQDCDGEDTSDDADGDGQTDADGDCDDTDATIYTGALDNTQDGIDNDCDGETDEDYVATVDVNTTEITSSRIVDPTFTVGDVEDAVYPEESDTPAAFWFLEGIRQ
jgi:hypothetical protein